MKRSASLVGRCSPYCKDMWWRYCCLRRFFPFIDTCLSCKDIARQSCAMVPRWRIFGDFWGPAFPVSLGSPIPTLSLKLTCSHQLNLHTWILWLLQYFRHASLSQQYRNSGCIKKIRRSRRNHDWILQQKTHGCGSCHFDKVSALCTYAKPVMSY